MSLRKVIFLIFSLVALGLLAGCGSSSNKATPPPTGGFSNGNLSGTYVFSTTGVDSGGFFLTVVGDFSANGTGGITGGAVSFNSADTVVGTFSNQPISSSSYTITADGRGTINLRTSTTLGTIILDFVLTSTSRGLVTEFDGNGTGSGSIDLQSTVSQSQLAGSYAFAVAGVGTTNASFAAVGSLTLGSTGNVTSGVEDFNNGGSSTGLTNLSIGTSSTVLLGTGTAPGTAQVTTTAGTSSFDVYPIDASHLKLIETDSADFISGDLFTQQTSLPSGTLVFTMAGVDSSQFPVVAGGLLPIDASGNITAGVEDFNDGGNVSQSSSVTGGFSAVTGGRSQITLNSFENGATNDVLGTYLFAAYPSSGGILLLEIDGSGVTGGVAFAQTSTSLAASQGYGLDLSAINVGSSTTASFEEDDIAEFTSTSSGFSGLVDFNDGGLSLAFDKKLSGSYGLNAGRGTATFTSGSSTAFNVTFYPVDGSTFLFIETDSNQIGTGAFQLQSASSTAQAALSHSAFTRPKPAGRLVRKSQ